VKLNCQLYIQQLLWLSWCLCICASMWSQLWKSKGMRMISIYAFCILHLWGWIPYCFIYTLFPFIFFLYALSRFHSRLYWKTICKSLNSQVCWDLNDGCKLYADHITLPTALAAPSSMSCATRIHWLHLLTECGCVQDVCNWKLLHIWLNLFFYSFEKLKDLFLSYLRLHFSS